MKAFINVINYIISLKWICQTFTSEPFQHLKHLPFFSKLVSHNVNVCSHYSLVFKPFPLYVVNLMEMAIKFHSNCRSASQVPYFAVKQWLEVRINGFLIKNLGKY